jgi:uncharacterized protein
MLVPMSRPIALVTGPTSGIGLSFARRLAALGHDLVLVARDRERLERLGSELGSLHGTTVEVIVADLGDRRQLAAVEGRLADPGRPVDLLVNNAGYGLQGSFLDHSVEDEQRLLDVLVTAVLRLMHAALGPMVQRGSGTIVNVSSVVGYLPRGSYSAAKGYVTSLSEWADLTYRHRGVHVMALLPGFTRTEFHDRMGVRPGFGPRWLWLDADRVVADALTDLANGRRLSVPSRRYRVLAAVAEHTPTAVQARVQGPRRR